MLRDYTPHKTWPLNVEQKFPGNYSLHKGETDPGEFPRLILPIILLSASPNQHNATGTPSTWGNPRHKAGTAKSQLLHL